MAPDSEVPFGDLARCVRRLRPELDEAVGRVLDRGWFILGPEMAAFEAGLADLCGGGAAVAVGNGTDALALALRAAGVGRDDEVVTTPLTAAFTALAIVMAGARPVFADVAPDTGLLDPERAAAAITPATRAIVPVHLYGRPVDMDAFHQLAADAGVALIEDAAQAHGALWRDQPVAALSDAAAFSFYPSKNLGAFGDAGAVVTRRPELAAAVRRLRDGGQSSRYRHDDDGVNSRLDEIQAALLSVRLRHLPADNARRAAIAARYDEAAAAADVRRPPAGPGTAVHHLYVVTTPHREALVAHMARAGVATAVHYPTPVHLQGAFGGAPGTFPHAERLAREVLSLPVFPELTDEEVARVADALASFRATGRP